MISFISHWYLPTGLTINSLSDFSAAGGITQQMISSGVASQAAYNLAAQQNLQSQFQAQQMAAATMQVNLPLLNMTPLKKVIYIIIYGAILVHYII